MGEVGECGAELAVPGAEGDGLLGFLLTRSKKSPLAYLCVLKRICNRRLSREIKLKLQFAWEISLLDSDISISKALLLGLFPY